MEKSLGKNERENHRSKMGLLLFGLFRIEPEEDEPTSSSKSVGRPLSIHKWNDVAGRDRAESPWATQFMA